jgi:serine/threonine protein kinase
MDFGLSIDDKEIGQQSSFGMEGTLDYMAPEVLSQRKPTSFQSDIYSFGSLLYMLLTGRKHFVRSSHILNDIKRLNEVKVLSPSQFNPLVTESMDDFIHKALEPNPENRFLSMHEMMEALHQVRRSMFSRSKKEPSMAKKISKWFK